jgi:hypothetical protein
MAPGRMPVAHHLHTVRVAAVDNGAHDPSGAHFAGRDQGLDLGQLGLLLLATPASRRRQGNGDHESGPPLQTHQPAGCVGLWPQRTTAILGPHRMQPTGWRLKPRLAFHAQVPLLDRVKRPRAQVLSFLCRQVFTHPGLT